MNVAAPSPTAPFSSHARLILLATLLCLAWSNVLAQAANSDYTADMPSVARIKAEIKGSDPTDTLARQVAVFTYLQTYIDRIKYNRTVRGPYTPDEQRLTADSSPPPYQTPPTYAKPHTPHEATTSQ